MTCDGNGNLDYGGGLDGFTRPCLGCEACMPDRRSEAGRVIETVGQLREALAQFNDDDRLLPWVGITHPDLPDYGRMQLDRVYLGGSDLVNLLFTPGEKE